MSKSTCMVNDPHAEPCDSCKMLEDSEARIVEAEKHLVFLKLENAALKTATNAVHDRLIGTLPLEIVSRIFEFYVDIHFDNTFSPFFGHRMEAAPLRLGAVSRTWRAIAWALPHLWTKMSVDVCRTGRKYIPELTSQWLNRSGQLPLSISIYQDLTNKNLTISGDTISLIRIVCTYSSRWETLDICLDGGVLGNKAIYRHWKPINDWQNSPLRYLRLRGLSAEFTRQLFNHSPLKPSPTHVTVSSIQLKDLGINWRKMTVFHTSNQTVDHCFKVLRKAPHLRKFSIYHALSATNDLAPTPITNSTLISLSLDDEAPAVFLGALTLPSLEKLRYRNRRAQNSTEAWTVANDSMLSLIERSCCQLKSLQLPDLPIADGLVRLLPAVSSLRSLSFKRHEDSHAECLFKCLSQTSKDGLAHLPHLNWLQLSISLRPTFPWETIPDIFDPGQSYSGQSSAVAQGCGLQRRSLSLHVDVIGTLNESDYIDTRSLLRISSLLEQGIKISIHYRIYNSRYDFLAPAFHHLLGNF